MDIAFVWEIFDICSVIRAARQLSNDHRGMCPSGGKDGWAVKTRTGMTPLRREFHVHGLLKMAVQMSRKLDFFSKRHISPDYHIPACL